MSWRQAFTDGESSSSLRGAFLRLGGGETTSHRQVLAVAGAVLLTLSLFAAGVGPAAGAQAEGSTVRDVSIPAEDRTLVSEPAQHFTEADFDQPNIQLFFDASGASQTVTQDLNVDLDIAGNDGVETLVVDYGEASEGGLSIPESHTDQIVQDGPLAGAVEDVEIRNSEGEIEITYDTSITGDVTGETQKLTLEFEGLTPARDGDDVLKHAVSIDGVDDVGGSASYRLTNRGATAIAPEDAKIDLSENPIQDDFRTDRDGFEGAFDIWQDQEITFQTAATGNVVEIYEYETESNADGDEVVRRGDQVTSIGTSPGAVTNFDTSQLEADERYIVEFPDYDGYDDDTEQVAVLEVDPLNLEAEAAIDEFWVTQPVQIEVNSDDITGGEVTAELYDENFNPITDENGDPVVVEEQLDGDGEATIDVSPTDTLDGIDDYIAVVEHESSEVRTPALSFSVVERPDPEVTIEYPQPEDDVFTRGDIVPITLEFNNTDTGTLTFGDRTSPQNIEIKVTVRDTNGDGEGTVYLNTFQMGHGAYTDCGGSVDFDECGDIEVPDDSRNHGFFTHPDDDGTALVGAEGQTAVAYGPALDIEGGSQGGGVIVPQNYDLFTVAGEDSYKDEDQFLNDRSIVRITEMPDPELTTWTAPGQGVSRIEPTLSSDIQEAINDGTITPADGTVATEDFAVLQLEAAGLEGIMHEAVLRDSDLETDEFLAEHGTTRADDFGDHLVTEAFLAAQERTTADDQLLDFRFQVQETAASVDARTGADEEADPVILDLPNASTGVVGATDDSGSLDEFFVPVQMADGTNATRAGDWLGLNENGTVADTMSSSGSAPAENARAFEAVLGLTATDSAEDVSYDTLDEGVSRTEQWERRPALAMIDGANPTLDVPARDTVEISGTTTVAAGTNLTISLATAPGEDPPFFKQHVGVFPEYTEGGNSTWSITEDFGRYDPGTAFQITIRQTGAAGQLTPDTDGDGQNDPVEAVLVDSDTCLDVTGNGECAADTTGDGLRNDIDGDGEFTISDVRVFFEHRNGDVVQTNVDTFDFDGDGEISIMDVRALFVDFSEQA